MTQVRRIWATVAVLVAACLVLAGCRVDTDVVIRVADNGGGTITVSVTLDAEAVARLGGFDVAEKIPLDDLRAAGWRVSAVRRTDDGGATIECARQFTDAAELSQVLAGLFGPGGVVRDPEITRARGWLRSDDRVSVVVDPGALTAGIANDAPLAESLRGAGIDPARLEAQLTPQLRDAAHLTVELQLPGGVSRTFSAGADSSADAGGATAGAGASDASVGTAPTTVTASSSRTYNLRVLFAVLAGLAVAGAVALLLLARRSARRARAA